jgi:ketosteroid isomerase-like protein
MVAAKTKPEEQPMNRTSSIAVFVVVVLATVIPTGASDTMHTSSDDLRAVETAFAATMANRDLEAFSGFLAPEAVFFGSDGPLRGADAVVEGWRAYFQGPDAPFAWRPDAVEVLASGDLGFSSGPVHDAQGKLIGTFNSVWRRDDDGQWRIVFDKGCAVCE